MMLPDEWARKFRRYPASAGVPGARDPWLTPYVVEFERAVAAGGVGRYRRAVLVCAAQSGKTDAVLDAIGCRLDRKPCDIIYVGPSLDFNVSIFEPRLMELFNQAPTLAAKVGRGHKNKKTKKQVAGCTIRLGHAGSVNPLKSAPALITVIDEFDSMQELKGHGSVLGLVAARGDSFADSMTAVCSTPGEGTVEYEKDPESGLEFWKRAAPEDIQSPIWRLFQEGTAHCWCWRCKHCLQWWVPHFDSLKWESSELGEHSTTPAQARRSAYVVCSNCGGIHYDSDKAELNRTGKFCAPGQYIDQNGAVIGEPVDTSTLSFWVSGLASPFRTFGERAESYLQAVRSGDQGLVRTAKNAAFGELYSVGGGDAPQWSEVLEHRAEYAKGELPRGVRVLAMACDVQKTRIYFVIRGFGARGTSWLVDAGILYGETIEDGVWADLGDLIRTPIHGMHIRLTFVDSGYRPGRTDEVPTNKVYDFCRRYPRLVYPTKGSSTPMRVPLVKGAAEVETLRGTAMKRGLELLRLDPDYFKSRLFEKIRWPANVPGSWYLPRDIGEDFARQVVSEAAVRLNSGRTKWVRRSRANHYLDCESEMMAVSHFINAQRIPLEGAPAISVPAPPVPDNVVSEEATAPVAAGYWEDQARREIEREERVAAENRGRFLDPHDERQPGDFWNKGRG
jgi:phage terminase large subunit GpA-like protein